MNCRRMLFLDTTIQIDRLFGKPDRKEKIRDRIAEGYDYLFSRLDFPDKEAPEIEKYP